jgi:hypothetical protein
MDRRTARFFALLLVAVVALGIGAAFLNRGSAPSRPAGPTVDGVVVGVDSAGLANVSAFRLRTDDGQTLQFDLTALGDAVPFPPGHLAEHLANSVRVRVWFRDDGGRLAAVWLEDAPAT